MIYVVIRNENLPDNCVIRQTFKKLVNYLCLSHLFLVLEFLLPAKTLVFESRRGDVNILDKRNATLLLIGGSFNVRNKRNVKPEFMPPCFNGIWDFETKQVLILWYLIQ